MTVDRAGTGRADRVTARPAALPRFDRWAASYDASQLQAVLYRRAHDAVMRQAQRRVRDPGRILDVGCGTGRLADRLGTVYRHATVVGLDASAEMIRHAAARPARCPVRFVCAAAECLPFAGAVFDLVVITLSLSHWRDQAAGLSEVSRVMAPQATLLVADVVPARLPSPRTSSDGRRDLRRLLQVLTACRLRTGHIEPVRSITIAADVTLIMAGKGS